MLCWTKARIHFLKKKNIFFLSHRSATLTHSHKRHTFLQASLWQEQQPLKAVITWWSVIKLAHCDCRCSVTPVWGSANRSGQAHNSFWSPSWVVDCVAWSRVLVNLLATFCNHLLVFSPVGVVKVGALTLAVNVMGWRRKVVATISRSAFFSSSLRRRWSWTSTSPDCRTLNCRTSLLFFLSCSSLQLLASEHDFATEVSSFIECW